MRKLFIFIILLLSFSVYSQSMTDIASEINSSTYKSITEPKKESDFNLDDIKARADNFRQVIEDELSNSNIIKNESSASRKKIIDLENEITKLNYEIRDLEYALSKKDNELYPLKVRYNVCSKIIYYTLIYGYSVKELEDFFTKEELTLCRTMMREWKRKYE